MKFAKFFFSSIFHYDYFCFIHVLIYRLIHSFLPSCISCTGTPSTRASERPLAKLMASLSSEFSSRSVKPFPHLLTLMCCLSSQCRSFNYHNIILFSDDCCFFQIGAENANLQKVLDAFTSIQAKVCFYDNNIFSSMLFIRHVTDLFFFPFCFILRASRPPSLTSTPPPCSPVAWTTGRTMALWPLPLCWRASPGLSASSQSASALTR